MPINPTNPWDYERGVYPYSGAQMDLAVPEGVSVPGYQLDIVAPHTRHAVYAMDKVAMGTRKVGWHEATMASPQTDM